MESYNLGYTSPRPEMVMTINYNANVTLPSITSLLGPQLIKSASLPLVPSSSRYKPHRNQTTPQQLHALQRFFNSNQYPSLDHRRKLSKQLNLSVRVIQVWFQNKRQTTKAQQSFSGNNSIKKSRGSSNTLSGSSTS